MWPKEPANVSTLIANPNPNPNPNPNCKAEVVPSNSYGQGNPLVVTDTAPLGYLSPEDIARGLSNGCECRDCCQRLSVACPCWAAHSGYTQLYDEEDIADGIPLQGVRLYGATVGVEESPKSDL